MTMRKKQRGQKRKLNALLKRIEALRPYTETNESYEHFHVPCAYTFINSPKTSGKVKSRFIRAWIQTAEQWVLQKPADIPYCQIAVMVCEESLWDAQIILFYDEEYDCGFFDRNTPEQRWSRIEQLHSLAGRRNISTAFQESCFEETVLDDGETYTRRLWFYTEQPL